MTMDVDEWVSAMRRLNQRYRTDERELTELTGAEARAYWAEWEALAARAPQGARLDAVLPGGWNDFLAEAADDETYADWARRTLEER